MENVIVEEVGKESVVIMSSKNDNEIKKILKDIQKNFGPESITTLGSMHKIKVETISTGSYLIDKAVGVGGYPKGRIVEIFGPESSGKTTLCLHAVAEAQKIGGKAAYIDVEHALDPQYAQNLGVDIENLIVSQPNSAEEALNIVIKLVETSAIDLIVLDSVAALVPNAELEGGMQDQQIGLQARIMSKALRKLNGIISKNNTVVLFINQLREKVGVMFGNPEITPGGRALKFFSSIRIEVRKAETISENGTATANKVKVKVVKNKVAAPARTCQITINYNQGIDKSGEIIELALDRDVITRAGAWYSYKGDKIGMGKESVKQWLRDNEDIEKEIYNILFKN